MIGKTKTLVDCPQCGGSGWVHGTAMDHAPGCDGSCRNCPVPVEVREPCDVCGGYGQVQSNTHALDDERSDNNLQKEDTK